MRYTYPQNIILDLQKSPSDAVHDYWTVGYSLSFNRDSFFFKSLALPCSGAELSKKRTRPVLPRSLSFVSPNRYYSNEKSIKSPKRAHEFNVLGAEFIKKSSNLKYNHFLEKFRVLTGKSLAQTKVAPGKSLAQTKVAPGKSLAQTKVAPGKSLAQTKVAPGKSLAQTSLSTGRPPKRAISESPDSFLVANLAFDLFDINFIKKERLYTKLKYSRSPAYDIVSGGSAALLAGFIGFLISEKFGIELVDSGDFYIAFMYGVFASFFCRPLLKIMSADNKVWDVLSLNFLVDYVYTIFYLAAYGILKVFRYLSSPIIPLRGRQVLFYASLFVLGLLL